MRAGKHLVHVVSAWLSRHRRRWRRRRLRVIPGGAPRRPLGDAVALGTRPLRDESLLRPVDRTPQVSAEQAP